MADGDKGATGASGATGPALPGDETESAPPGTEGAGVTGPAGAPAPAQPNPQTHENAQKAPAVTTLGKDEDGKDIPVATPNAPFSEEPAKANRKLFRAGDTVAVYQPPATDPYYGMVAENEKRGDAGVIKVYRKADDVTVPVDTNVIVVTKN